ncbi:MULTISPECIES: IclR family transcriptional regulator [unclassified Sulfitobacter]|uniref:IclR family transcriptional regulator n=1 Tax=unclassified Sulfitobacter TaxID=196795 RepID=UPI0007C32DB1|nr:MULTISPECIES: IclR family transcriptional regulator [unclassified Sulfitobacter]MAM25304.1 IclR family transcriptional regulator [Paracoccaceae bacterium]KZX96879.1 IclR family transcriptional regulator [Sulfitobacter sp. HI0023]KZY24070.1 IclR family transcriptional regulator [Sulfitobacter sp. HI0040]KZZ69878.1 IclR family transcriptional regulator [Sulfitobacter sp. HI0129]MBO28088.1 IclR family transcriptional regulator [Paracoccaceae bacterium]
MDKTNLDADRYLVPGLIRGFEVLDAFTPHRTELSLSEIARHLGLSRSAAFRTVYTLTHLGFLLQDARSQTYALGPAVLRLGHGYMASRELVQIALPEIENLRDEIDWSTHLGVRDGRSVLYMLRVASRMGMGSIVHVGSRLPAAATTMGRVLLTDLDEEAIVALYRDDPQDGGAGQAQNMRSLLQQWKADRQSEIVVQLGSFERGMASVAAPIRDMSGSIVGAINATRAFDRPEPPNDRVTSAVLECARAISRQLGAL